MKRPIEVAYEVKHILTIQLSYSTASFSSKINESLHTQKHWKRRIRHDLGLKYSGRRDWACTYLPDHRSKHQTQAVPTKVLYQNVFNWNWERKPGPPWWLAVSCKVPAFSRDVSCCVEKPVCSEEEGSWHREKQRQGAQSPAGFQVPCCKCSWDPALSVPSCRLAVHPFPGNCIQKYSHFAQADSS